MTPKEQQKDTIKNETALNSNKFIFGTAETCEFFGISRQTLSTWAKKGAPQESRGKWDIQKLVKWRYGGEKEESPEVRKLKAEADLKETKAAQENIKLAIAEGRYIPVNTVTKELRRLFSNVKKTLMSTGHRVAAELNAMDPDMAMAAKSAVDEVITDALNEMAKGKFNAKNSRK